MLIYSKVSILSTVTGQLVALVISSPRTAGQLVAKTRRQNEKVSSLWVCVMLNKTLMHRHLQIYNLNKCLL